MIVFVSCVVATMLYPPLKGKNIAVDEQDKNNTDPAVAETVDTDPAPPAEAVEKEAEEAAPAEVTVEKEMEAVPPPAEVIDQTKKDKGERLRGWGLGLGSGLRLGLGLRLVLGLVLGVQGDKGTGEKR